MNLLRKRSALRTVLGIALAATVVVIGSRTMQSRTPADVEANVEVAAAMDESAESRTPIEVASLGPQIGERVPAFSLPDQDGRVQTLESVMGRNGTMLLFHRSADW